MRSVPLLFRVAVKGNLPDSSSEVRLANGIAAQKAVGDGAHPLQGEEERFPREPPGVCAGGMLGPMG